MTGPRGGVRTLVTLGLLLAALAVYFVILGARAVLLIGQGTLLTVALGIGVFILPVIGVLLTFAELRFGLATSRLARRLEAEGGLPADDLPRRASGRVDRDAADAVFARRRAEVEADESDWRAWYRLAVAYDAAGDRRRARASMRTAIDLERSASD